MLPCTLLNIYIVLDRRFSNFEIDNIFRGTVYCFTVFCTPHELYNKVVLTFTQHQIFAGKSGSDQYSFIFLYILYRHSTEAEDCGLHNTYHLIDV